MGGNKFAAKTYFYAGSGAPFEDKENSEQLKMELVRQTIAKSLLASFARLVRKSGAGVSVVGKKE